MRASTGVVAASWKPGFSATALLKAASAFFIRRGESRRVFGFLFFQTALYWAMSPAK